MSATIPQALFDDAAKAIEAASHALAAQPTPARPGLAGRLLPVEWVAEYAAAAGGLMFSGKPLKDANRDELMAVAGWALLELEAVSAEVTGRSGVCAEGSEVRESGTPTPKEP